MNEVLWHRGQGAKRQDRVLQPGEILLSQLEGGWECRRVHPGAVQVARFPPVSAREAEQFGSTAKEIPREEKHRAAREGQLLLAQDVSETEGHKHLCQDVRESDGNDDRFTIQALNQGCGSICARLEDGRRCSWEPLPAGRHCIGKNRRVLSKEDEEDGTPVGEEVQTHEEFNATVEGERHTRADNDSTPPGEKQHRREAGLED
mmetsp:Transcript_44403/g.96496  ORF Transcript_44403/g.96496 Transcript_44403/m.96496 type:complete len:204 (-) Transcript_44403:755-1366(-)